MRMQKSEKIMVVILLAALGILGVADWMFSDSGQQSGAASGISVEGQVLDMSQTRTGENLIIHLDSVQTPVFISRASGAKNVFARVHQGDRVKVRGNLAEYQGQNEIVVSKAGDVEVIGS